MKFNFVYLGLSDWLQKKGLSSCEDLYTADDKIFTLGRHFWILKTFKFLKHSTLNISLSENLDSNAINILHRDHYSNRMALDYFVVCVRADRDPAFSAQVELLQNGLDADDKTKFFLPHWPQEGIIPRDPNRKGIQNLSFFGKKCHVSPELESLRFKEFCDKYGLVFKIHENDWSDYFSTDVVIAVRDGFSFYLDSKPAHKIINSWIACVPSILNPEYGYLEIVSGTDDAIFVNSIDELIFRLKSLIEAPELYNRMVSNGKKRAEEFSFDQIALKWELLLKSIEKTQYPAWRKKHKLFKLFGFLFSCIQQKIWGVQETQYPNNWLRNVISYVRIFFSAPGYCLKQLNFTYRYRYRRK